MKNNIYKLYNDHYKKLTCDVDHIWRLTYRSLLMLTTPIYSIKGHYEKRKTPHRCCRTESLLIRQLRRR